MPLLRSLLFWFAFALTTIVFGTVFLIFALMRCNSILLRISQLWATTTILALQHLVGLSYKINGAHLINEQPFILASRHESTWETIFLLGYLKKPSFILKRELCYIPFYGWTLPLLGMLIIDRSEGIRSIKKISKNLVKIFNDGRQLVVFPEGTRVPHGQRIPLKSGIYLMHKLAPKTPIICAQLNSGKFWPKHAFILKPGIIEISFAKLEFEGALNKEDLLQKVQNGINLGN